MPYSKPPLALLAELAYTGEQVVFVYSPAESRFPYLSPAFEQVWLRTRQSVSERPSSLLKEVQLDDLAHVREIYRELLDGRIIGGTEFRIPPRGRPERWVCISARLSEDHVTLMGTAEDITA